MRKASPRQIAGICLLVLTAVALLCTFHPTVVRADGGPIYFSAGILVPTTSNDIRMVREVLTIDYTNQIVPKVTGQPRTVDVHARFWFRNEGKAVKQQVGFPLGREYLSGFGGGDYWDTAFHVTVDGATIPATSRIWDQGQVGSSGLTYDMWYTFDITFAAGQTRVVDATYRILPRGGYFLYVLQTGRLWKGPIGDLTIDVNFGRTAEFPDLLSVQPAGYHTQGNHILWHFINEEPEQDIEIESMTPGFWQTVRPLKEAAERTGTEGNWYRYAMALLPEDTVGRYYDEVSVGQSFVDGLQSSTYADYVERTLVTAINHSEHGSARNRVLAAAFSARFSYYFAGDSANRRVASDFRRGVRLWDTQQSTRAHDIYSDLLDAGLTTANASPEETRLLAWLTLNMAGESMKAGSSLLAVHELEKSQDYARKAGVLTHETYQTLLRSVSTYLASWSNPRLLVDVSNVPRIEIQQQEVTSIAKGPAWRARVILHLALPSMEVPPALGAHSNVKSQPDWTKAPGADTVPSMESGISDTDPSDYLVILAVPEFVGNEAFRRQFQSAVYGTNGALLDIERLHAEGPDRYYYWSDANRFSRLQTAGFTWLDAIAPYVRFDTSRGIVVDVPGDARISNIVCDEAEAELKPAIAAFDKLSWTKDYEINTTLQHNLDLVEATRGKNPSVTTVTFAADGTASRTSTSTGSRTALWIVLAGIGGLLAGAAMGILIMSRRKRHLEHKPHGTSTDSR
jgi:hypothetical protein